VAYDLGFTVLEQTVNYHGTNKMSQPLRSTIRANLSADAFSVKGDKDLFDKIVADQEKYSGLLRPAKNWDLEIGGQDGGRFFQSQQSGQTIELSTSSDEQYLKNFFSLQKMMDPFVGSTGLQDITKDVMREYYDFLKGIDHLGILPNYFEPNGEMKSQANGLLITDLGSMIDVNMISSFLDPANEKYRIAEVGGGYGRLAEVVFNIYGEKNIKYILIDAVPAGLMYSYLYLSRNFPNMRIGFYYNEDPFDMDVFDCYIMPAWHFDISEAAGSFDCCINIQSMQEMEQYHVDYYLRMFNDLLKDGTGIAYLSNEKDYIFQGKWNYPVNWRLLLRTRTPRSWTRNSPTEVFVKGAGSFEKENQLLDSVYSFQLKEFDRNSVQLKTISNAEGKLEKTRDAVSRLQGELKQTRQAASDVQLELQKIQDELQKSQVESDGLQTELQKSQQNVAVLQSILSRTPLALEELTIDKVEESIQLLDHYYGSAELPEVILQFESIAKVNAHLVAANLYLKQGRYHRGFSHLFQIGRMDPLIFLSIQTLKIIGNGLIFHLRRDQRE